MGYTKWQLKYIHATDGVADNSAVEIIGILDARVTELEAQLAAAQEREKVTIEAVMQVREQIIKAGFGHLLTDPPKEEKDE